MQIVTDLFAVIGGAISNFATSLASAITSVTGMFYTPGTDGGAGSFTFLGVLLLVTIGIGIVYWSFRLIKSLVHKA